MPKTFIISDTHFGHSNCVRMCDRPYPEVDSMDESLIANWDSVVNPDDTIYHLGDLMFRNRYSLDYYMAQLNGIKHLVIGNHDKYARNEYERYFASQSQILQLKYAGHLITLCHYPMYSWNASSHGSLHIYGHVHRNTPPEMEAKLAYNACVEINNYTPIELDHIVEVLTKRKEILTQINKE